MANKENVLVRVARLVGGIVFNNVPGSEVYWVGRKVDGTNLALLNRSEKEAMRNLGWSKLIVAVGGFGSALIGQFKAFGLAIVLYELLATGQHRIASRALSKKSKSGD